MTENKKEAFCGTSEMGKSEIKGVGLAATIQESIHDLVNSLPKAESPVKTQVKMFTCMLYCDDVNYNIDDVLSRIISWDKTQSYAFIKHDSDYFDKDTFSESGQLLGKAFEKKKDHYHVAVYLTSKTCVSDIAMHLGLSQRFIQRIKSFDGMLLYLTHKNAPEKHQYDIKLVSTNIFPYLLYLHENYVPEKTPYEWVFEYIEQSPRPTKRGFVRYMQDHGQTDFLRKYWSVIRDLIDETNRADSYEEEMLKEKKKENMNNYLLIKKLCTLTDDHTFSFEDDNGVTTQYKLSEDGEVDIMGYSFPEYIDRRI